jgi:hypothetical protein
MTTLEEQKARERDMAVLDKMIGDMEPHVDEWFKTGSPLQYSSLYRTLGILLLAKAQTRLAEVAER